MKRVYVAVVAAALVAGVPALAQAHQSHATAHEAAQPRHAGAVAEPSVEPGKEGGEPVGEEEEHAPKPINWFDFGNKEQPPWAGMFFNFVVLLGMYYVLGKKSVVEGLKNRRASVAKEIEEAQKMRAEAEARALKYQEKLSHLEVELKELRETLRSAGEAERDRLIREAEEKAGRMERDAKFLVEQEMKQMRGELTRDAVEMAVVAAEELLRKRLTPSDQERLAEDYLAQLSAKRPSGAQAAAAPGGE